MAERSNSKAVIYRRKAQDLIRLGQRQTNETAKRYLLELAGAWLELAWQAEEEHPID